MLKILFLTKSFLQRVEKSSYYLELELKRQAQVLALDRDGDISEILQGISFTPDFILINDFKPDYSPRVYGFPKLSMPYGAIMHDLKYKIFERGRFFERENIRHIFTVYREASFKWFPQFADRFIWFPHHVPHEIFKDYKLEKQINWLMTGAMFKHLYPARAKMLEIMRNEPGFVYHPHPGYKNLADASAGVLVGEDYAREINRAKMQITCDSNDHFPVMKYFETTACNTLLLATPSQELVDLGFVDGITFVAVEPTTIYEKAYYYLHHEKERLKIAKQGYEMVRERHSTEIRVSELLDKIQEIISSHKTSSNS
ncbi:glycosyltransferase [Neobacillus sp. SM06]|uniref:glycosyltransferase n=1 Tax=Neobacillus sp. SM06 TaxID=3422492 RepID=UPI003D29CA60